MAKINTLNYQTVASWNGSQDLFVVEQPDGTKVATPAMVKQFIEAGDFEATGEVKDGHGNILKDVVAEIGDLSQTGLTGNNVADQLVALMSHDNETVKQLNIYKANNVVSIYGLLNNLDSTQTIIAYATLDAKYRPASGYAIGALISTTAPYLPVGSVWIHGTTGLVSVYKEAARTDGYVFLAYLT